MLNTAQGSTFRFMLAGIGHIRFIANSIWYETTNVPVHKITF